MKLKKFIEKFVEKNTLIRLQYKIAGGHTEVPDGFKMEWWLVKGPYANHQVVGVTDIAYGGHYPEAVNICIKRNPEMVGY